MTADATLEIRKLPPRHISQLSSILEYADQWKKLMAIVPNILSKTNFQCNVSRENPPKYNLDHIRLIEDASKKYKRPSTEVLLEEWGCSGRIRPAVGHLLHLLTRAELFRAADYVAEKILNLSPPERPTQGPAALISTNLDKQIIEDHLNNMNFSSYLFENVDFISYNPNLNVNDDQKTIPQIVVTPDADLQPTAPSFREARTVNQEVSSMIKFSSEIAESLGTANVPILSALSNCLNNETVSQDLNSCSFESEGNIPQLSELQLDSECANVPNLSALNLNSEAKQGTTSSCDIPNLGDLMSGSYCSTTSSSEFMSSSRTIPSEIPLREEERDGDNGIPNLSILIPESTSVSSNKSRPCTSPLPNLSLKTNLPHFAYKNLEIATNGFNEEPFVNLDEPGRFLGAGSYGNVFLATGLAEKPVAVKKIVLENVEVNIDDDITKQFVNEVEVLCKFKHDNLLSLVGYSCDGCTYCLLYEYIPGGTLEYRLRGTDRKLSWQDRLNIAVGTAKAISYLHTAFSSPLIHRDVKTANILLDSSNEPKLGDFGITKLLNNKTMRTCTVIGTSAYMAPEALRGDISVKCDTFSFGVVLLELLTSLPSYEKTRDGFDLVTHVEEKCEDSIQPLLDTSIGTWVSNDISFGDELYLIAIQCLEEKKKRPVMVDVVQKLVELSGKLN